MSQNALSLKETVTGYMSGPIRERLNAVPPRQFAEITEIRPRINRPVLAYVNRREFFLGADGLTAEVGAAYSATYDDIAQTMELISAYSLYAFEDEMRNGYITIPGGHRIGLCGRVSAENGAVKALRGVSGLNVRIAHEVIGCGEGIIDRLLDAPAPGSPTGRRLLNTMIISPPACGKTTLLRDLIRLLSAGVRGKLDGVTVGVADERSEIAGCYRGLPQNDVGPRTDVLDACPKACGMSMLLRAMSPKVIAVDELGGSRDAEAVEEIVNAGVALLCTAHGFGVEDVSRRLAFAPLMRAKVFERFVVLEGRGVVKGIFDGAGRSEYEPKSGSCSELLAHASRDNRPCG